MGMGRVRICVGCEVVVASGTAGASVGFRVVGGRVKTTGPPICLGVGDAVWFLAAPEVGPGEGSEVGVKVRTL